MVDDIREQVMELSARLTPKKEHSGGAVEGEGELEVSSLLPLLLPLVDAPRKSPLIRVRPRAV